MNLGRLKSERRCIYSLVSALATSRARDALFVKSRGMCGYTSVLEDGRTYYDYYKPGMRSPYFVGLRLRLQG